MMEVETLYSRPLDELLVEAWAIRQTHFPPVLKLAAPGVKRYEVEGFRNNPDRFAAIGLTGRACALRCEHCRGQLLESMYPAPTPQTLPDLADELMTRGCQEVLLSGGPDRSASCAPERSPGGHRRSHPPWPQGHCSHRFVDKATAQALKAADADQVLVDVIGDEEAIRQVYHLDKKPGDYAATLDVRKELAWPLRRTS